MMTMLQNIEDDSWCHYDNGYGDSAGNYNDSDDANRYFFPNTSMTGDNYEH